MTSAAHLTTAQTEKERAMTDTNTQTDTQEEVSSSGVTLKEAIPAWNREHGTGEKDRPASDIPVLYPQGIEMAAFEPAIDRWWITRGRTLTGATVAGKAIKRSHCELMIKAAIRDCVWSNGIG